MKNLEDEYKRFYQEETPDLWNRIEAGLTDKKAGHKKIIFPFRYVSACAPAILLLVLLPGIWILGRRKAFEEAPQKNEVHQNMSPEAAGDIAADTDGFWNEEGRDTENSRADSAEQYVADAVQPEENADAMLQGASGAVPSDDASSETATVKPSAEESKDEQILGDGVQDMDGQTPGGTVKNADEQIAGVMEVTAAEQKDGYMIYYLRTNEGEVVSAVPGEELPAALQTGESYLLTLKTSGETAWDYVIETVETAPAE